MARDLLTRASQLPGVREFVAFAWMALVLVSLSCSGKAAGYDSGEKVILLGFDGMDYEITQRLMGEGRMPNFQRLAEQGSFSPLETAVPPQSPVAWSNFITGMDSGGHGIFDFVHRDPDTMLPYLSTSHTEAADKSIEIGECQIPLGGSIELLRKGTPFWQVMEDHGVETTIVRMPANFPPSGTATRELSGMGTPDLVGTSGTFSFYTSELFAFQGEDISGGEIYEVYPYEGMIEASLHGPDTPYLKEGGKVEFPFTVYTDPDEPVAMLEIGDEQLVLEEGEWSDWVPFAFELDTTPLCKTILTVFGMPTELPGIVRFYLKQTHPELELYATPLNMDPEHPAMPISTPDSYAAELAEATGAFYTQEMPEDTKALSGEIFSVDEFLAQTRLAAEQFIEQYKYVLSQFESGFLFYYFGNLDQTSHMMMRTLDPDHPAYDPEQDGKYADVIEALYEQLDGVIGHTLENMPAGSKLIAMSDHGFTSWRRSFHLNTWLMENGYLSVKDANRREDPGYLLNVDWSGTKAYGLGLNGLYVNVRGREKNGIVDPGERDALMREIADKLLATIDPATGEPAITKVYIAEEFYQDRGYLEIGPDMQVGYAKGTRCSFESAIGEVPLGSVIEDNTEAWSGDHLMDHEAVPGILLTSQPLERPATSLKDLAASILMEFGIEGDFPVRAQS